VRPAGWLAYVNVTGSVKDGVLHIENLTMAAE
jgi:hypothetical protein